MLVVISSADQIALRNGKMHPTGYFLRELTDPLKEVLLSGYDVEFATPGGKTPVVDANSLKTAWYWFSEASEASARLAEAEEIRARDCFFNGQQAARTLEYAQAHMDEYVGLLVPGGHAPMVDLKSRPEFGGDFAPLS